MSDSLDCSTADLPVHHQLPELTQTRVHLVGDANHLILCCPLLLLPLIFPSIRVFPNESILRISGQSIGVSASASVLPKNIQDWFILGLTGLTCLQSMGISRVFSNTTVQKHQFFNSAVLNFLYSPTLTSLHDSWKYHSFDKTEFCWQSNISAF